MAKAGCAINCFKFNFKSMRYIIFVLLIFSSLVAISNDDQISTYDDDTSSIEKDSTYDDDTSSEKIDTYDDDTSNKVD